MEENTIPPGATQASSTTTTTSRIDPLRRHVPWSGAEILAVYFASVVWPVLLYGWFLRGGWYSWFYGNDFLTHLQEADAVAQKQGQFRLQLWAVSAALPLQVLSALLILRAGSGTRPADIGLTHRRLGVQALAGVIGAVVLVPGVYGIQALVIWLVHVLGWPSQEHTFTTLWQQPLYPVERVLVIIIATIGAPMWEEVFFRGIVQPWVIHRRLGGVVALLAAGGWTLVVLRDRLREAAGEGPSDLLIELVPILVLLALAAVYGLLLLWRWRLASGLFASAVLFAWVHVSVWPSPIPLVWLALGLGWLALKSGSLVGPMVLHALFNAVACLLLLWPVSDRANDESFSGLFVPVCCASLLFAGTFRTTVYLRGEDAA
jgi:membrane protease YdiL (CAAX protease family)